MKNEGLISGLGKKSDYCFVSTIYSNRANLFLSALKGNVIQKMKKKKGKTSVNLFLTV